MKNSCSQRLYAEFNIRGLQLPQTGKIPSLTIQRLRKFNYIPGKKRKMKNEMHRVLERSNLWQRTKMQIRVCAVAGVCQAITLYWKTPELHYAPGLWATGRFRSGLHRFQILDFQCSAAAWEPECELQHAKHLVLSHAEHSGGTHGPALWPISHKTPGRSLPLSVWATLRGKGGESIVGRPHHKFSLTD